MLSKQKRLTKLIHYYQSDFNLYTLVQSIIKDEVFLEDVLEQIHDNYTDIKIYKVEFWNFVDGLRKIERKTYDSVTGTYQMSTFNAAGQKLSDLRLLKLPYPVTWISKEIKLSEPTK